MPGTLYVVATPIGNLEDVTLRALRVLREVSVIAAEDTRRTARLLQHYSISTPTTSLHEHNEHVRVSGLIQRLLNGESIALVSDAGTPVISDPGSRLVAAAHERGIRVEPLPGPSAVVAALSASGFAGDGFLFAGFAPARAGARKQWLESLRGEPRPVALFEAPHRIVALLRAMAPIFGDRPIALGRELTKAHEELVVRPASEWAREPPREQGEFTVVIGPAPTLQPFPVLEASDGDIAARFGQLIEIAGLSRREAIRQLATEFNRSSKDIYGALERHKKLVE